MKILMCILIVLRSKVSNYVKKKAKISPTQTEECRTKVAMSYRELQIVVVNVADMAISGFVSEMTGVMCR